MSDRRGIPTTGVDLIDISDRRVRDAIALRRQGKTWAEVAQQLGVRIQYAQATVARYAMRHVVGSVPRRPHPHDWSPEAERVLDARWREGRTAKEIAQEIGCSRSAVIGKAHRLGLPARPSPIHRRPS